MAHARRRRRWTVALIVIGALLAAGLFVWHAVSAPAAPGYTTAAVTRGTITRAVTASGTVNPVTTVQVGSYVSGVVDQVLCDYNTAVKKGQLCAKIDPRPYQIAIEQDQAELATSEAQLAKDQANLVYAKLSSDRNVDLATRGLVTQDAADAAKSTYDQANAQVTLDQATIKDRQAALDSANVNLGYTDIVSPVDGTVIERDITVGQTVAASFQTPTLFLIASDLAKMEVDTNISEGDIGSVKSGQPATFTVEAFPDHQFQGTVSQVRQAPQAVQNVVTYDAIVSAPNPDLLLKPGMTATVHVIVDQQTNALIVPDQALRFSPGGVTAHPAASSGTAGAGARGAAAGGSARGGGQRAGGPASSPPAPAEGEAAAVPGQVWVLRNGQPVAVAVTVGVDNGTSAQIVGGQLQAGDLVILAERSAAAAQPSGSQRPPGFGF